MRAYEGTCVPYQYVRLYVILPSAGTRMAHACASVFPPPLVIGPTYPACLRYKIKMGYRTSLGAGLLCHGWWVWVWVWVKLTINDTTVCRGSRFCTTSVRVRELPPSPYPGILFRRRMKENPLLLTLLRVAHCCGNRYRVIGEGCNLDCVCSAYVIQYAHKRISE